MNYFNYLLFTLFFLGTYSSYAQSNSYLEIDVKNHYYSILFKRTNELEDGSIEYRLDAEAYDISSCSAIIATDESIDFGYFINDKEVTMREFVAFNPFGYTLGCGSIDKNRMGVFLTDTQSIPTKPIVQKIIVNKGIVKEAAPIQEQKVEEVKPEINEVKPEKKTEKDVQLVKNINGEDYLVTYKPNGEVIKKRLNNNKEENIIEEVPKPIEPKPEPIKEVKSPGLKPAPKVKKVKEQPKSVKRIINGVEYLITYTPNGEIIKKPLRRVEKKKKTTRPLVAEVKKTTPKPTPKVEVPKPEPKPAPMVQKPTPKPKVVKQPKVENKKVVKTFEQKGEKELIYLPVITGKEKRQLLRKRYSPRSVVYIDGKRYSGLSAEQFVIKYHKSFLKMYPVPARISGNNRNTYYLFTTQRAYVRSNYREAGDNTEAVDPNAVKEE